MGKVPPYTLALPRGSPEGLSRGAPAEGSIPAQEKFPFSARLKAKNYTYISMQISANLHNHVCVNFVSFFASRGKRGMLGGALLAPLNQCHLSGTAILTERQWCYAG